MGNTQHDPPADGRRRAIIEAVEPEIDAGKFPAKRIVGDMVVVTADIFTDGHDGLSAVLLFRKLESPDWSETPMRPLVNDRWKGEFAAAELGQYVFSIEAWVDAFKTWERDLAKRIQASQDTRVDYLIGAELVQAAASRASGADAAWLRETARALRDSEREQASVAARTDTLEAMMARYPDRRFATRYERELRISVDPAKARFSTWYEFFPRSVSEQPGGHGTFADCILRLPYVASMGFDVLYLPPVHPIGAAYRKGKNNAVTAEQDDVGSPWAIGGAEGGHKSVHPDLGTFEDFRRLVKAASDAGLQIALDIAFQVSPDHPYVREHPEWFRARPDGSIQYAENPPKKYQDIYPFDFESEDWRGLWQELQSVFEFWIEQGVRIFRVDNPHTKAFPFWEWVIAEIKRSYPDVLFLSEAFTRPKVMYRLAKVGFSQSYTYFPWRHTKDELTSYLTELTGTRVREYFRPNHWPNTPDILTEFLQTTGRPGFLIRIVLAATMGASYGIYGPAFELMESAPRHAGSEEYLDSEKYQLRSWNTERPDSLREFIALLNGIRRDNAALQNDWSLRFHRIDNEQLIAFSKQSDDGANLIVVVVNLDPRHRHSGYLELPVEDMKIGNNTFQAHELLTGARYIWSGARNYVEIDPSSVPAHIFAIRRRVRTEREFEYFL
jgi:starch synthase (maltosyl-transferring)